MPRSIPPDPGCAQNNMTKYNCLFCPSCFFLWLVSFSLLVALLLVAATAASAAVAVTAATVADTPNMAVAAMHARDIRQ